MSNTNQIKEKCRSCGVVLETAEELSSKFCTICNNNKEREQNFSDIVQNIAIAYFIKGEIISDPIDALRKSWNYAIKLPYWREQKEKGVKIPLYDEILKICLVACNYYARFNAQEDVIIEEETYDFFISHSWSDKDDKLVHEIVGELKNQGYSVWYDRELWDKTPGDKDEFLFEGIDNSTCCIPFLCEEYFDPKGNCVVELDYIYKKKEKDHIFPVWTPSINKDFIKNQTLGEKILDTKGIPRGPDDYDPIKLANTLITWKIDAEGMAKYPEDDENGVELYEQEARAMKELEKIIGDPIPSVENFFVTKGAEIKIGPKLGFTHENNSVSGLIVRETEDKKQLSIQKLPESIRKFKSLKKLVINIGNIPEWIGTFSSMEKLDLSDNELTSLPDSIGNLLSLEKLNLDWNKLTSLPDSIGNLISLEHLNLTRNKLTSFPEIICKMTWLQSLDFASNQITSLPESIGNLKSLKKLKLSGNKLTSLPDSIGNLLSLEKLNLDWNKLTSLPDSIGNLKSLKKLKLSGNKLTSLPEIIGNLISLEKLNLEDNQLTSLPDSIGNLKSLKKLKLSGNKLTSLPESIGNLISLKILDLSENKLTSLPKMVKEALKKLKKIGCKIDKISKKQNYFT